MSVDAGQPADLANDLPPRTWRGWWLAWPKWFRIGCWAGLGLILLNASFAILVYLDLFESPEVRFLKRPGVTMSYYARRLPMLDSSWQWHVGADVGQVRFGVPATDADLLHISRHFSNLQILILEKGGFTEAGLASLSRCQQLTYLDLSGSDVDDATLAGISEVSAINFVGLAQTLVTDEVIPHLRLLPKLRDVNLSYTDVSLSAIQEWRKTQKPHFGKIATEKDGLANAILGTIRWSDGARSRRIPGSFEVHIFRPKVENQPDEISFLLTTPVLWWDLSKLVNVTDGDYRFTLKLGGHEAEPVVIRIENGEPSTRDFEFRMPVTKQQALGEKP